MTKLTNILQQAESRRLELKAKLPINTELAKTIISFANHAGDIIYL
jgi:predicted HTH transcriptional regulator